MIPLLSWLSPSFWREAREAKTQRVVEKNRSVFEGAVRAALFAARVEKVGDLPLETRQHIGWVAQRLKDITVAAHATTRFRDHDALRDQADDLGPQRAYVLPAASLAVEARALREELSTWRVPKEVLDAIDEGIARVKDTNASEAEKRETLADVIAAYDYWDWYVDWSAKRSTFFAVGLFVAAVAATLASMNLLTGCRVFFGFCTAGVAGAILSVLLKMPALAVYGEAFSFHLQAGVRIAAGLVASAIGLGLLTSGVVGVALPTGDTPSTFAQLIQECEHAAAAKRQAATPGDKSTKPRPTPTPAAAAEDGSAKPTGIVAESTAKDSPRAVDEAAAVPTPPPPRGTSAAPPAAHASAPCPPHCDLASTLILFSFGALFGFSERVITSFEGVLPGRFKAP